MVYQNKPTIVDTSGSNMLDDYENNLINTSLRNTEFTPGSSIWLALSHNVDTDSTFIEPNNGSYVRHQSHNTSISTNGCSVILGADIDYWKANSPWSRTIGPDVFYYIKHFVFVNDDGEPAFYGDFSYPKYVEQLTTPHIYNQNLAIKIYGDISTYLANSFLYYIFDDNSYSWTTGSAVYASLYAEYQSGAITTGSYEISSSALTRIEVGSSASWASPSTGSTVNIQDIIFTTNASTEWGPIYGALIFNHPTSGCILYRCPFSASRTVNAGDGFKIPAGYFKLYID